MKMRGVRYVRAIKLATGMLCAYMFVSGCSGLDDLCLHNNCDFAVTLHEHYKYEYSSPDPNKPGSLQLHKEEGDKRYGPVAAHSETRFSGRAGYHGGFLESLHVQNESGKDLGILKKIAKKVEEENHTACNGSTVWDVTVGP